MKRVIALLVVALMSAMMLNARNVSGYVSDKEGKPVAGLKMIVRNVDYPAQQSLETATDAEGHFSVAVPDDIDVENLMRVFSQKGVHVVKYWTTSTGAIRIVVDTDRK